jgi:hypothetical protein
MRAVRLMILAILFLLGGHAYAQQKADTFLHVRLNEVQIKDTRHWGNDTLRYRFNQTRYYVQTILPYLEAATKVFNELNARITASGVSKKNRKQFVNAKEEELRTKFEEKVKGLNETQGVLLVKLIGRQTGVNIYSILNEFKNPFTALKWQTWARINGFNLNKKYDPLEEILLEQVMMSLDYPLPDFYEHKETVTALKN